LAGADGAERWQLGRFGVELLGGPLVPRLGLGIEASGNLWGFVLAGQVYLLF